MGHCRLSQVGAAQDLAEYDNQRSISQPHIDVLSLYDHATFFALSTNATLRAEFRELFLDFYRKQRRSNLHVPLWKQHADVVVTAAAIGDLALLHELTALCDEAKQPVAVSADLARMMEVACVNGHVAVAEWLTGDEATEWATRVAKSQGQDASSCWQDSVRRAVDVLWMNHDTKTLEAVRELALKLDVAFPTVSGQVDAAIDGGGQETPQATELLWRWSAWRSRRLIADRTHRVVPDASRCPEQIVHGKEYCIRKLSPKLPYGVRNLELSDLPGVLPRVAIIEGNLPVLQSIWSAYRLLHSSTPMYSFQLAMHFAATEGQLEIMKWLHTLPGTEHKCRPDTMAMAVRCGWADIVEWLHFNIPESAQTMSVHCVNEAARWGHVDTLLVCHKYDFGEITVATMECAAQEGQLAVVQCLHLLREDLSTTAAMDMAIRQGHVSVVEWLHHNCAQAIDSNRLALALTSNAATKEEVVQFMWMVIGKTSDIAKQCAVTHFRDWCTSNEQYAVIALLHSLVSDSAKREVASVLTEGLHAASSKKNSAIAERLFPFWVTSRDPKELLETLHRQVQINGFVFVDLLLKFLMKTNQITSHKLDTLFRSAVEPMYRTRIVGVLVEQEIDRHCPDALRLIAQGTWRYERSEDEHWLQRRLRLEQLEAVHTRRTRTTAIQALAVVTMDEAEAVLCLLENEDLYYTDRVLLDHAPPCLFQLLVRFWIENGRAADVNQVRRFHGVVEEDDGLLSVDEVEKLAKLQDPEIDGFVVTNRNIVLPCGLWKDASICKNVLVIE